MPETNAEHPMVQYLNSLRTQEEGANPTYVEENRSAFLKRLAQKFDWFPTDANLRIETRLDHLASAIVSNNLPVDVVFLTGDAGDGKTAVCAAVARGLGHLGDLQYVTRVGGWTIVKDASELPEDELEALASDHLGARGGGGRLLVAINEGRLRRLVHRATKAEATGAEVALARLWTPLIEPALAAWIDGDAAAALDATMRKERVAVVNFRHRMHVRSAVPRLLARWTPAKHWEDSPACGGCSARVGCPILANAVDLREERTQQRVAEVLTSAHYSGHRLPFRRLQAVLALACTGGLRCEHVQTGALAKATASPLERLRYRFYESLFHRSEVGPVAVRPEPIARAFAPADAGAVASITTDQEIASLVSSVPGAGSVPSLEGRPLREVEADAVAALRTRLHVPQTTTMVRGEVGDELAQLTRSLRRWLALTSDQRDAPWLRAVATVEDYAARDGDGEPLRRRVVKALNRLHRMAASNSDQISSKQLDPAAFRNPERLSLELDLGTEFDTRLRRGPVLPALVSVWLEACASEIELQARPVGSSGDWASLRLDARLVEVLESVAEGYALLTGLGPYRRDLARFHAHLVALAAEKGPARLLLRVEDRSYRLAQTTGPTPRLRFEGQG